MTNIVQNILENPADAESRLLPYNAGTFKPEAVIPCDVSYDSMDDVPAAIREDRRYTRLNCDYSIKGMLESIKKHTSTIDVLIHSVAFSAEIKNQALDTSRAGYLNAISISAYSLTALTRAALPLMENRPDGTAVLGLTYLGGERVVPHYGGGMATAKAALEIDAKQLAFNVGTKNIRVNLISAGPYASRAAKGIGNIQEMIDYAAARSPLQRGIKPEEVANAAVFLCSPLASGITGEVMFVDCGRNVVGV